MKKKFLVVNFIIFLLTFTVGWSQTVDDDTGQWSQYFLRSNIAESFEFFGDVQYRTHLIVDDFQQFIARGSLGVFPGGGEFGVYGGYGFFVTGTRGSSTETTTENRLHQDLTFPTKIPGRLQWGNRIRIEERWPENQDFQVRFRYFINLHLPINNATRVANTLYLRAWNEVFVNAQTETGQGEVPYFDRNWASIGLGYQISGDFAVDLGYMRETTTSTIKDQLVISLIHTL